MTHAFHSLTRFTILIPALGTINSTSNIKVVGGVDDVGPILVGDVGDDGSIIVGDDPIIVEEGDVIIVGDEGSVGRVEEGGPIVKKIIGVLFQFNSLLELLQCHPPWTICFCVGVGRSVGCG